MKITEVNVNIPVTSVGKVVAFASIVIDECFAVHNIRIVEGQNGLFVAMPNAKYKEEYRDVCHPIKSEAREALNDAILKAYEEKVKAE